MNPINPPPGTSPPPPNQGGPVIIVVELGKFINEVFKSLRNILNPHHSPPPINPEVVHPFPSSGSGEDHHPHSHESHSMPPQVFPNYNEHITHVSDPHSSHDTTHHHPHGHDVAQKPSGDEANKNEEKKV